MKRVSRRAASILIIVALVITGLGSYILSYINDGESWVLHFFDLNIQTDGRVFDRNGVLLAEFDPEEKNYADSELTRLSVYHLLGEFSGRIGNSILSNFWKEKDSFSLSKGIQEPEDRTMNLTIDSELCGIAYKEIIAGAKRHEKNEIFEEWVEDYYKAHPWADEDEVTTSDFTDEDLSEEDLERIEKAGVEASGAAMLMNWKTGEILCMTSAPSYDPEKEYTDEEFLALPNGTFLNKCLSATLTPGSVFKLITSAAAIETVDDIFERTFYCEAESIVDSLYVTCVREHYSESFIDALADSCNISFARISVLVGQNNLYKYAKKYGFLQQNKLNNMVSKAGSFPSKADNDGETAWCGIGQATDLICPYAMLRFVSAIANDGLLVEPSVMTDRLTGETTRLVKQETAATLKEMMANNVKVSYYPDWYFPGMNVCGKTGTAEVGNEKTNAWFTGFLNDEEHPYAVVVVLEDGGSGLGTSVPIAAALFKAAIEKY